MPPLFQDHLSHLAALRAAALQAVDPGAAVLRALRPEDLEGARRVFIVGGGKAGVAMARAAARIAGRRLAGGVLAVPQLPAEPVRGVRFIRGGHPLPDEGSLAGGAACAQLLASAAAGDLVVALISGGGSALLERLQPGLTLADLRAVNAALLRCGAAIDEINCVRQRLSRIKGGGLARLAGPARVLGLILSDVIGDDLAVIASGPTAPPTGAPGRAAEVLRRYGLLGQLPPGVVAAWSAEAGPDPAWPAGVANRLIGSNRQAGAAAVEAARRLGFAAEHLGDDWQGEARLAGVRFARQLRAAGAAGAGPRALVAGGETTVTVRGPGRGGRNLEAALAAVPELSGGAGLALATFATDGVDGPTDAAGAVVTGDSGRQARALGLDAGASLAANNSYPFFAALGGLIRSGPTGTNVNDLWLGLAYPARDAHV